MTRTVVGGIVIWTQTFGPVPRLWVWADIGSELGRMR